MSATRLMGGGQPQCESGVEATRLPRRADGASCHDVLLFRHCEERAERVTKQSSARLPRQPFGLPRNDGRFGLKRRFVAAVTALMLALPTMTGMFGFSAPAYADDTVNTVPKTSDGYETVNGDDFYSNEIYTGFVPNNYTTAAAAGPGYGPYTDVPGVLQSQSTTSPTSFAAGLPLGTIFIDQKKVSGVTPIYKVVSDKTAIIAGLGVEQMSDGLTMGYDGTKTGAIKMVPGKINKLDGDLFTVKYEDAAILPNGERADLVITYSNAQIVIDQRYLAAPDGTQYYELITPKRDTAIAYRDNYGTNAWQNPALLTPLAGETFGGNPVFTDAGGYKYVRITASNGENRYYAIQDFGSDPVDLDPSSLSRVANKTHNYRGTEYPVFTDGTKEYILPDEQYYHGSVGLARGNLVARSGTDFTRFRNEPYLEQTRKIVNDTISSEFGDSYIYGSGQDGSTNQFPVTGTTLDVSYKIVNKDGTPAAGTFVFAVAGVNLDRDPDTGTSGNNVGRPLWYSYADDFEGGAGKEHSFFSEALEILDGQVSDYVYVRPNNNLEDNPDKITGVKGQYFWPNVSLHDGNIKFIGNQINTPSLAGNDNSYNAGFVTLANAATGFKIRHTGHGGAGGGMNSGVFESKQIWYRYTESTGKHGSIAVTSEGNFGGTLDDGGAVYKPEGTWDKGDEWDGNGTPSGVGEAATHVVAEGKTVTYTMTPDIGYKISKLWIGDQWNDDQSPIKYREITFDGDAIAAMKKGDTQEITTAAGNKGLLTYNEDGTYTLTFEYAQHHEAVHVEWEPTTADILVAKVWDDKDDKDGLRAAAYANEATKPKFKLQMSLNRGATWTDVTSNNFMNGVDIHPQTAITEQTVPSGLDSTSNKYLDGTYPINNDPNKDSTDPDVVQHPYTWEYLPVYTYDENGVADKIVLYRIVEEPDPAVSDYKKAQYFNSQSFELTSSKAQSVDGWLILEDSTDGKKYVKKGDGQYYEVDANGNASDTPATNQPKAANLGGVSSNQYYTVDKGIPYIAVQAKNEHEPREVYIELTKFWNDESIKGLETTKKDCGENGEEDCNAYERKDLTFVLHGETSDGAVNLNGDAEGTDREISITIVGDDAENDVKADVTGDKVVEGYTVYKDAQDTEYALVKDHATYEDGYYPVSGETIDYENGSVPSLSGLTPVMKGDGTYKIDDDHFGALIEHLSTHEAGKPITYTLTEKIDGKDANSSELAWTTTGGNLTPVKNDSDETIGYTTEFINTPVIDKDITPLPLTIQKRDKLTEAALGNATFTVYTDVVSKTKAAEYELEKIDGQQVYTNDISKYVKKSDNKYYEVDAKGTVAAEAANPQPDERTLKESYAGGVENNEVTTDAQGHATINFKAPGTYYVVETEAPVGYNVDGITYTFVVDDELKSVTLEEADSEPDTAWWKMLYELLFGDGTTDATNWVPNDDNKGGTLTVDDDPIRANVLINKVWDDNNDQDGLRKNAAELPKVKLQKTTDPTDENSWADVVAPIIPNASDQAKLIPDHDAPLIVDQDNYYTWDNLPAYENGKLITYRVIEFGGSVNGGAFLPEGDHPEETAYAWTAKTAVGDETDFNIANITDPDNPTSRNRTVTVTNKHIPGKVKLNVSKDWADDEGVEDQRRAANLTLYKTVNGAESVVETIDGIVPLTDQNNFKTWDNLPAFENGYPVTYRVVESAIDQYATTYTKSYDTDNGAVNQASNSVITSDIKRTWDVDRNETTEATIAIRNANLRNLTVQKTWINGANSNVTYKLYRTTSTDPAVIDWEQAKVGTPGVNDPTQTLYNWTPDSNWEEVTGKTVGFAANRFTTSAEGDTESEILEGLPKADANGNTYIYRVWEEVDPSRYEANQTSNTTVVNTNIHAENGYANVNVVKELQGRDWAKSDSFTDRFYFTIEPYEDDGSIYNNAGAYGFDANGAPITDPDQVPMPESGGTVQDIADVDKDDTQVGAIGRNVAFDSIEYSVNQVDMGQTAEYYYKVYEVYDAAGTSLDEATEHTGKKDGITYAGAVENGTFKPTVHTLKVVVSSDSTGKITTALFWDRNTTQSAVPVYTNTYDSSAEVHAHVIKEVQNRAITGSDAFNFTITNMAGAPMRSTENGTVTTTSQLHNAGTITEDSGSQVQAGAGGYDPVEGTGGNYRAMRSDSSTWIKVSDLAQRTADGRATDTFIYRVLENAGDSVANDNDLTFDSHHIYLKVVATDNLDGTITIEKSYWYDETCNSDQVDAKVLTAKANGSLAPEGSAAGDVYGYEPAAIFTNSQTIDIPVIKEWKDAPAVEDVTLRLQRKLIPLSAEAGLTYSGVERAAGDWVNIGRTTIAPRSDFVNDDGTPKYEGSTTTASTTYENIEGFNKDLPKYVTENGITYRAVYKLVEDNTSDAYETTYYSKKGDAKTDGNQIFIDGETLVVTNTVTASNEANIAAVKQLLGRQWLNSDDFEFTLEPAGKGKYKADGSFDGIDSSDNAKAAVPMPEDDAARESTTSGEGKDTVATTHAKKGDGTSFPVVDPNGDLERLARFGAIEFDINDLTWLNNHYEGDFFYTMKEKVPDDATDNGDGTYTKDGITYDTDSHTVHVKVQGNRTDKLYVQIAYDEKTVGDASTGTQFTPVYTNRYDAVGTVETDVDKLIMGRDWNDGETFDFTMAAIAGAPFRDGDESQFQSGDVEAALAAGKAAHTVEGAHIIRMVADAANTTQKAAFPKLKFVFDDLDKTVETTGDLTYSDGSDVLAGMRYGQFMYVVEEVASSANDLERDTDTEYYQITVIDKGDGALDTTVKVFGDRLGQTERPATSVAFVNQVKRDLAVTKAWDAPATSDVTLRLEWSTDGTTWNSADGTGWLAGFDSSKTIAQNAAGADLTVTWSGLPAYVPDDDDIDTNDTWVRYRVVEDEIANVETRYSTEAYAAGDKSDNAKYSEAPIATEAAATDTRVTHTYVTNFVKDLTGTASVNVVKQLIGRGWTDTDSFGFTITPVESKIGSESAAKPASERPMPMPMGTNAETGEAEVDNIATASTGSTPVTVGEYNATFKDIVIKLSDLALNDDNIATGEFVYTIKEAIPDGATEITGTDGKTYYVKDNIKYTSDEHTVKIVATNDGTGKIDTTVSYDGRPAGDFVPVYTNEAIVPTPIEGTKTWVGGEASEHVNANDAGVDALGITLQRKTSATDWEALDADDAGRELVVVWENATGNSGYTVKAKKSATENVDPVLDTMNETGDKYEYRIVEANVPADYAVTYATTTITDDTITNTSTKKDSLKVTKTWADEDNGEGLRPDKVVMHLYKQVSGSNVQVEVASQEIANGGETTGITWDDLPVYDAAGNKITYVVIEEAEYGYTTTYKVLNPAAADYTTDGNSLTLDGDKTAAVQTIDVKNTLVPATDTVSVTKVWGDDNNRDGKRPSSVSVNVYEHVWDKTANNNAGAYVKNDTAVVAITLDGTADDSATGTGITTQETAAWTGTVSGLPTTKNGKTVFYTVGEDVSDTDLFGAASTEGKYSNTPVITGNQLDGFTVTNTYTPETIDIQTTKVWNDSGLEALSGVGYDRPKTVSFQLKADGTAVGAPVAVSESSEVEGTKWAYQWADLPKYKNGGTEIAYTVEELAVPDGYTPAVTGNMTDGFIITNTPTVADKVEADIVLHKIDSVTEKNIGGVVFELKDSAENVVGTYTTDDYGVAHINFEQVFDSASATPETAYTYTLTEKAPATGYEANSDAYDITVEVDGQGKAVVKKVELKTPGKNVFEKLYELIVGDKKHAEYNATSHILTVKNTPKTSDVTVTKRFVDENGVVIPHEVLATSGYKMNVSYTKLKGDGTGERVTAALDLPNSSTNGTYKWTLEDVVAGTDVHVHEQNYRNVTGYDFQNVAVAAENVTAETHTDDANFTMPDVSAAGSGSGDSNNNAAVNPGMGGGLGGLAMSAGAAISDVNLSLPAAVANPGIPTANGDVRVSFTNTYKQQTGTLNLIKIWEDADNQDGKRPEAGVEFIIAAKTDGGTNSANVFGSGSAVTNVKTVTFEELDFWERAEENLPLYYNGKQVTYYVTEDTSTLPEGYSPRSGNGTGYTLKAGQATNAKIVNEYTPQTDSLKVTKVWNDNNNAAGLRPNNVKFHLYKEDGTSAGVEAKTVSGAGSATWTNLPVYENGTKIKYTVVEEAVAGYTTTYTAAQTIELDGIATREATQEDVDAGKATAVGEQIAAEPQVITATNSLPAEVTSVTVTKNWNDSNNVDGLRAEATVTLYESVYNKTSKKYDSPVATSQTGTLAVTDNAQATFSDLPAIKNGKPVMYSVVETTVPTGYTAVVTGNQVDGFTVTNTHVPNIRTITVTKVWDDAGMTAANYQRPKDVSVNLFANGTAVGEARGLSEDNSWATSWTVPVNDANGAIEYVVKELTTPTGYTYSGDVTVTGTGDQSVTITNKAKPSEVQNPLVITVKKTNLKGDLLEGATFNFKDPDGNEVNVTSDADGRFTLTFPKDGNYTLKETSAPTGYKLNGIPITLKVSKQLSEINLHTGDGVWANIYNLFIDSTPRGWDAASKTLTLPNEPKLFEMSLRKNYDGITELPDSFTITVTYTDQYGTEQTITRTKDNISSYRHGEWANFNLTGKVIPYGSTVTVTESGYEVAGKAVASTSFGRFLKLNDPIIVPVDGNFGSTTATFTMPDIPNEYYAAQVAFTNTYVDNTNVTIPVAKVWADANDQDGKRPAEVTFRLFANGVDTGKTVTLSAADVDATNANRWAKADAFTVPTTDETNTPITYTVREDVSRELVTAGYTDSGEAGADKDYTITNTREPDTTGVIVTKVWDDVDNQDGKRADVTIHLDKTVGETTTEDVAPAKTLATGENHDQDMTATWTGLPAYEGGKAITYTVREDEVTGYTTQITGDAENGFTVTNTLTPDSGEALGDETWGGIDQDQLGEIDWKVNPNNPVTPSSLVAPDGATTNRDGSVTVTGGTYRLNPNGTVTFTPKAGFVGDPTPITVKGTDKQGNEVSATYTPHVVNNIETDDVTRTITYTYAEDGSQAADTVTQTVSFTRTGEVNPDTGEVTFKDDGSDWTVVGSNPDAANFAKVDSPAIEGYTPNRESVPAVTVKPGDDDITEEVVYAGDQTIETPCEITVVKVDSKTGNPLAGAEFTLSDPYGTEFTKTTGEDGKVTFTLDAEGGWSLVETGAPENHKLDDVYSWTIKVGADVTIETVTEDPITFLQKIKNLFVDLTAEGYDAATNTLTVENPPIDEKTITYVDPDPEDPTNEREVLQDTIKMGEDEPGQPKDPEREGYIFGGWLRDVDKDGNVIYKANWIEIPEPGEKVIQYVDPSKPEGEQEVLREVITRGENEPAQPDDPTRDGWKFTGWKRTIDKDGNVTYTATWEEIPGPERVTITYDPANGEDAKTETINRNENEPGQPADPTRDGFTFTGWQRVEDENGNVTYTARWKEIPEAERIKVTYDFDNGKESESTTIERGQDEPGQPADPTRDGYIFGGWLRDVDEDGNVTYKARWIEKPAVPEGKTITVKYVDENGKEILVSTIDRANDNEPAQPADPEKREGWQFRGWQRTQDADGNVTYTERWEKDPEPGKISVTYDPGNGEPPTSDEITRGDKEPGQPADPTRDGYTFGGWDREVDEDGNVTYKARWNKIDVEPTDQVTVIYDPANGNPTSVYEIERGENEPGQPKDVKRDGFIFGGWLREQDGDGNVIYTANWIENPKVTITYDPGNGADPTMVEIDRNGNEPGQPADPTREGFTFTGWQRVEDENGNVTYTARWKEIPKVTITYDPANGEDKTETIIERGEDEPGQPADPTRDGYVFGGWLREVDDDGNVTYKAKWIDSTMCPAPTPTSTPTEEPSVDPTAQTIWVTYVDGDGKTYMEKTTIAKGEKEPPAPADPTLEGYVFDGWNRQVDENGNVTYTARWKKVEPSTPGKTPVSVVPTPPAPTVTPVATKQLSKTGEAVGLAGIAVLALAGLGGGLLALRRRSEKEVDV